ncbi:hypothetical protein TD95_001838 [Thielaviopsis punctulata]|uniref:Uncharacterized protein n=1 Tax=Thielaviopsis punctulata TaxID=72032 RepID=A0A0F4ZCL7_9PEZI|nr:hypothetical protein TD95_001838 [Thielaviopsis punctulata]
MPKVTAYTPSYLAPGAAGHALFAASSEPASPFIAKKKGGHKSHLGARRTVARRGTELFVASGREIRWGDLAYLKDVHENRRAERSKSSLSIKVEDDDSASSVSDELAAGYRYIKTPVADDIRHISISPNGNYLAVLTAHTCHIMVIPDSSHLSAQDTTPIKPKIWTLGPTIHVTSKPAIASALWHPLGVNGSCIVTVSEDAIVRVWEISLSDRWSFDQPTLDIDLKKLADGVTLEQDYSSSVNATNAGFSPDSFEMEVASACFASRSSNAWSPFTLWILMREGDVYALCPLLPKKWSASPALMSSLSLSVVEKLEVLENGAGASNYEKLLAQQQVMWMTEIDAQQPLTPQTVPGEAPVEVYSRPNKPGACPRLQGPFTICADLDDQEDLDSEYTDIMVIGPKMESEDYGFAGDSDDESPDSEGLSLSIICLLSTGGQVKVCLDIEGVEAQWLPSKTKANIGKMLASLPQPSLLLYQAMDSINTADSSSESWPAFSPDVLSKYAFYVTHNVGITYFSLAPWVFRLESELQNTSAGSEFRIGMLMPSHSSIRELLYMDTAATPTSQLAASVAINDPDVGYGIISSTPYEPVVLLFDLPEEEFSADSTAKTPDNVDIKDVVKIEPELPQPLFSHEARPAYTPSHVFDQQSVLPVFLDRLKSSNRRMAITQELRLSPMTLQVLTDVHQILSDETHSLGLAASDLFVKCEHLHSEMIQQLSKAAEIKSRIDKIVGGNDEASDKERIDARLAQAQERQTRLAERLEALRKDANGASKRDLSHKERAFIDEVQMLENRVLGNEASALSLSARKPNSRITEPWQRMDAVHKLAADLLNEARELVAEQEQQQQQQQQRATLSAGAGLGASVASLSGSFAGSLSGSVASLGGGSAVMGESAGGRVGAGAAELRIPAELRKTRLQQVKTMLSRETALIEAVTARLERLQTDF